MLISQDGILLIIVKIFSFSFSFLLFILYSRFIYDNYLIIIMILKRLLNYLNISMKYIINKINIVVKYISIKLNKYIQKLINHIQKVNDKYEMVFSYQ